MLRQMPKQLSFHTTLYNKILKNHILKTIKDTVDFSFLNELSANIYCKNFGCPAKEPVLNAFFLKCILIRICIKLCRISSEF